MGRILSVASPDSGLSRFFYDLANNLMNMTDANGVTAISQFDPLGRLTAISYPQPEQDISFTYDQGENGQGRLTAMTDSSGETRYAYDAWGRLIYK